MRNAIALAAAVVLFALPAFADEEYQHPFEASVSRTGIRRVVVDIPAGEIDVRNGTGRTIAISGQVRGGRRSIVDDTNVVIDVSGDEATITRTFGPNARSWSARTFHNEVRLRVEVPSDVDVELGTHFGEVSIDGEFGDVNVDLRAGEIHLRTPHDAVRDLNASVRVGEVHADLGRERVSNEGVFPGATHFHNANGRRSQIDLHTTAGEVHVTLTD